MLLYEEFQTVISQTEKILMKRFKRLVFRGKRHRCVPVLFNSDVQGHIELFLKCRNTFVKENNNYLFARLGLDTPICGYKVLQKNATASKVKNPAA